MSEEAKNIRWELIQIDGKWYYLRALVKQNLASGSLLEASTVLEKIGMSENENAKMLLLGEKEEITENGDWAEERNIEISKKETAFIGWLEKEEISSDYRTLSEANGKSSLCDLRSGRSGR